MQVLTSKQHPSESLTAEEAFRERLTRLPKLSKAIGRAKYALSGDSFAPVFDIVSTDKIGQDPSTGTVRKHRPVMIFDGQNLTRFNLLLRHDDTIVRGVSSPILKERWTIPFDLAELTLDEFDSLIAMLDEMAEMPR